MRLRRRLPIILAVLVVAATVALVVVLRKHAPPEPARLLPGADGFVYLNLQWMRRTNLMGELPPVPHDPEYDQFIQGTGFQFERDLDEAAIAIHCPASSSGPNRGAAPEARFSEVFVGKIRGDRLNAYLRKISSSVENYHSQNIYNIPLEGRTVRVAILGVDTVAVSNHPDPQVLLGMIDRSRKLASPFGGPALLRQYYKHVPLASLAWALLKVEPGAGPHPTPELLRWDFLFNQPAVVLASVRYLGAVHFKAVAFTGSEEEARRVTDQVSTFLNLFHTAEGTTPASGSDPDVKALLDSLTISPQQDEAVLTATVPLGFIRKLLAEVPTVVSSPPAPPPSPAAPAHPKVRK